MNLCNEGHEEVCFEGRKCPACIAVEAMQSEVDGLNNDIAKLENRIGELEVTITNLEAELEATK